MKSLQQIFICSFLFSALFVNAGLCSDIPCLDKIGSDETNFISEIKNIVGSNKLDQVFVDAHKDDFYKIIAKNLNIHCPTIKDVNAFADKESILIPFKINNQPYDITVKTDGLFDYFNGVFALLVKNDSKRNPKHPGDIVKKSEMPTDYFYSSECSDRHVLFNLSNKAAVNQAGQKAFAAYGGAENEFFLDFPVGKKCRAFPGLVLGDFGTWGAKEKIVVYTHYGEARKAFKAFAEALKNSMCGNQDLAVYLVDIRDVPKDSKSREWLWITFGLTGAAIDYFSPRNLSDIQQVTIMSEPELIR